MSFRLGATALAWAPALLLGSCSDDAVDLPERDDGCEYQVAGSCVGAPKQATCAEDVCTSGVECAQVFRVADDAELASAIASATGGDCIALAPGQYGEAVLPAGVSLLGKGVAFVSVARVVLSGGSPVARGMTVGAGGIQLEGASGARLEAISVVGSAGDGIEAVLGASFEAVAVEVHGAARYGISAFDTGDVSLDRVLVRGSAGPGLWAQCQSGCDCVDKPTVSVGRALITDNKVVGVSLVGVVGLLQTVDVTDHSEDGFDPSGGIVAHGCAELTLKGARLLDNTWYGLLVDAASAIVGGPSPEEAVEISRNQPGAWVQNLLPEGGQPVSFDNVVLEANHAVGLGLSGESKGIMFWNSAVIGTKAKIVPAYHDGVAAQAEVGDAISWTEVSGIDIQNVTLSGSARAAILIDGEVAPGSTITSLTLSGGDEDKGVLQQNLPEGGLTPMLGPGVSVSQPSGSLAVATGPALPQ